MAILILTMHLERAVSEQFQSSFGAVSEQFQGHVGPGVDHVTLEVSIGTVSDCIPLGNEEQLRSNVG